MVNRSSSYSLPPVIQRLAVTFRLVGWVSFSVQIVLAVVSGFVLVFAAGSSGTPTAPGVPSSGINPGTGAGLSLAVLGLLTLFGGAYWAFFHYIRLSRKFKSAYAEERPKPSSATRTLEIGLAINLAGMLFTILGAQAIVGTLVAKSFAQGFGGFGNLQNLITPRDIFLVQANTNTILAHFVGLVSTLWILRTVNSSNRRAG